jgi:hypothetical protein
VGVRERVAMAAAVRRRKVARLIRRCKLLLRIVHVLAHSSHLKNTQVHRVTGLKIKLKELADLSATSGDSLNSHITPILNILFVFICTAPWLI